MLGLDKVATALVAPGKGILAADEPSRPASEAAKGQVTMAMRA